MMTFNDKQKQVLLTLLKGWRVWKVNPFNERLDASFCTRHMPLGEDIIPGADMMVLQVAGLITPKRCVDDSGHGTVEWKLLAKGREAAKQLCRENIEERRDARE